ncbi:MAG: hypothetical protein LBG67_02370 [Campylobacteraceae bacterium]|jgi:hypothetical protein|nr:hypothetical protein [Campylobacteraceae bacterium]
MVLDFFGCSNNKEEKEPQEAKVKTGAKNDKNRKKFVKTGDMSSGCEGIIRNMTGKEFDDVMKRVGL